MEPKACQNGGQKLAKQHLRTSIEQMSKKGDAIAGFRQPFSVKTQKTSFERSSHKYRNPKKIIIKASQNGSQINAKTHYKSMQTMLSPKGEGIMKRYVLLKCENMLMHWKGHQNHGFEI